MTLLDVVMKNEEDKIYISEIFNNERYKISKGKLLVDTCWVRFSESKIPFNSLDKVPVYEEEPDFKSEKEKDYFELRKKMRIRL